MNKEKEIPNETPSNKKNKTNSSETDKDIIKTIISATSKNASGSDSKDEEKKKYT